MILYILQLQLSILYWPGLWNHKALHILVWGLCVQTLLNSPLQDPDARLLLFCVLIPGVD